MNGNFKITVDQPKLEVSSDFNVRNVQVSVDSSTDINSYMLFCDCKWIKCERNRNNLRLLIDANTTIFERSYAIELIHNCDSDVVATIDVIQSGMEYELIVGENDKELKLDPTPIDYETKEIKVTAIGGKKEFYIKQVRQYTGREVNLDNDTTYREEVTYDNGLQLKADNENGKLIIKSYGRTFVDEENYYEITLAHKDKRSVECVVKVDYINLLRHLTLTPDEITFNALGLVKDGDTNTVTIDFGDTLDYGYGYNLPEGIDWLAVTENPTSLTFNCVANYKESRECLVEVYSVDDADTTLSIRITQDKAETKIETDVSSIIDDGNGGTYEIIIYVYGVDRVISNATFKTSNNVYDTYIYNCILTPNDTNKIKETTVVFKIGDVAKTVIITQYSLVISSSGITNVTVDSDNHTITVTTNPKDSQIALSSSARWCTFTRLYDNTNGIHQITVKCDSNIFGNMTRKCKIMITNAENPDVTKLVLVTQKGDINGVSQFELSQIN